MRMLLLAVLLACAWVLSDATCCMPAILSGRVLEVSRTVTNPAVVAPFPSHPLLTCGRLGTEEQNNLLNYTYSMDFHRNIFYQDVMQWSAEGIDAHAEYWMDYDSDDWYVLVHDVTDGSMTCTWRSSRVLEMIFPGMGEQCPAQAEHPVQPPPDFGPQCESTELHCGLMPLGVESCDRLRGNTWFRSRALERDIIAEGNILFSVDTNGPCLPKDRFTTYMAIDGNMAPYWQGSHYYYYDTSVSFLREGVFQVPDICTQARLTGDNL